MYIYIYIHTYIYANSQHALLRQAELMMKKYEGCMIYSIYMRTHIHQGTYIEYIYSISTICVLIHIE